MPYGNSPGRNGRQLSFEERLDLMRNMTTQGRLGYSQDDDTETQFKKRLKAFRSGYTSYFDQKDQAAQERKQLMEQQEEERKRRQEELAAHRSERQQQRRRELALGTSASQRAIDADSGLNRTPSAQRDTIQLTRPADENQPNNRWTQAAQTSVPQTSTDVNNSWIQDQISQRQKRQTAMDAGQATPQITSNRFQNAQTEQTQNYQQRIDEINFVLPYLSKKEDMLSKYGSEPQVADFDYETRHILHDYQGLNTKDDVHNTIENLVRERQDLQAQASVQKIRDSPGASQAYEFTETARQDLTDFNYMLNEVAQGNSADSERYQTIKRKYGVTDEDLADYARAARSGASEDEFQYLTGLTGGWQKMLNVRSMLEQDLAAGEDTLQKAGIDVTALNDYISRAQAEQETYQQMQANQEYMQQGVPQYLLGTALSIGSNIGAAAEGADFFVRNRNNQDPMSDSYRPYSVADLPVTAWTQSIRQGGSEATGNVLAGIFGGGTEEGEAVARQAGNFLYGVGTSILDSATVMAATAGVFGAMGLSTAAASNATLAIMGSTAASNTALNNIEKGATNDQVVKTALAAGVFEAAFERISIDRLMNPQYIASTRAALRETAKQMLAEGSEEMCTEVANICTDVLLMKDKSDFEQARQDYRMDFMQNEGMSYDEADKEAKSAAISDMVSQVLWAGAGGALSGMVMGAGHNFGTNNGQSYAADILEDAKQGIMPPIEEQELIRTNMVDGESLLSDARQEVQKYRERNAARIAEANRTAQQRAAGVTEETNTQGEADTQEEDQADNQDQTKKRQSFQEWWQARQGAKADSRIGARDMRTDPAASSARGSRLNTATMQHLNNMAKKSGVNINIVDSVKNSDIDGFYYNGEIYITESALENSSTLVKTATHEVTHSLKEGAPEQYNKLVQTLIDDAGGEENFVRPVVQAAQAQGIQMDRATAIDEAVAIQLEQLANSPTLLENVASTNYNALQRIWVGFRNFLAGRFGGDKSAEAMRVHAIVNTWGNALDNARKNRAKGGRGTSSGQDSTVGDTSPTLQGDGVTAGPAADTQGQTQQNQTETQEARQDQQTEEQPEEQTEEQPEEGPVLVGDGVTAGADQTQQVQDIPQTEEVPRQAEADPEADNQEQAQEAEDTQTETEEQPEEEPEEEPVLVGDGVTAGQTQTENNAQPQTEAQAQTETDTETREETPTRRSIFAQNENRQTLNRLGESRLVSDTGLEAGTEYTAEERQLQQDIQNFNENNRDMQMLRRNYENGTLNRTLYEDQVRYVQEHSQEYQDLMARQRQLELQRANVEQRNQEDRQRFAPEDMDLKEQEAQLQEDQRQLQQDVQDYLRNNPAVQGLNEAWRRGDLSYDQYRQNMESLQVQLRPDLSDRSEELASRRQQIHQARAQLEARIGGEDIGPALISEDGLLAGDMTAEEREILQQLRDFEDNNPDLQMLQRNLNRGLISQYNYRQVRAGVLENSEEYQGLIRQLQQLRQNQARTAEVQTETTTETVEATPEEVQETEEARTQAEENPVTEEVHTRIQAETTENETRETDNRQPDLQQMLRDSLDRGEITQEAYDQAVAMLQGQSQNQTRTEDRTDTDETLFRRRSVSSSAAEDMELAQMLRDANELLRRQQRQLKDKDKQLKHWKEQVKLHNLDEADQTAIHKMVASLLSDYNSEADLDNVEKLVTEAYKRIASLKSLEAALNDEQVLDSLRSAAWEIVTHAWQNDLEEEYGAKGPKDLKSYFRNTALLIPESLNGEIESRYGSMEAFRKATFGRIKITRTDMNADTPDTAINTVERMAGRNLQHGDNEADCLFAILDFVDEIYSGSYSNPFEGMKEDVAEHLANEMLMNFDTLPKVAPSWADKERARTLNQRERDAAKMRDMLARAKAREQRNIQRIEMRQAQRDAARADRMTKNEYKDKIYRHAMKLGQMLTKPSDKNHIPDSFKGAVIGLLESLDLESEYAYLDPEKTQRVRNEYVEVTETNPDGTTTTRRVRNDQLTSTKRTERARALMAEVEKLKTGGTENSRSENEITIDPDLVDKLDKVAQFGDKRMSDLTQDELKTLWETVITLEHSIRDANKMLGQSRYQTVSIAANKIIEESKTDYSREDKERQAKDNYAGVIGKLDNLFQVGQLTPETYFHRLGEAGDDLFRQMRRAQDRQVQITDEGIEHYKSALKDAGVTEKQVQEWESDENVITFDTIDGKKSIKLTTGQMMEFYLLSKRQQAIDHIIVGGIAVNEGETTTKKGPIPVKVQNNTIKGIPIGAEGINMINSKLTDTQKKFADNLQKYLSGALATHGNEASIEVYGYSKFTEKNYWPIQVQDTSVRTELDKGRDIANYANMIPNYGMAKATVPHAENVLMLHNITNTYTKHLNQMATYSAWLSTNENLTKIFNYKYTMERSDGTKATDTTKQAIATIMGNQGENYYKNLIFDISMGTKAGGESGFTDPGFNAFKAAAVGANIRVILQQPTAIIRAAELLNPKYLLHASNPFKSFERAKEHSGIARWKDWGYFEMDTGRNLRELLLGEEKALDKLKNVMMAGAGLADNFAWGILWAGVEAETRDLGYQEGTQEYWDRCNERFGEIVDRTQVVDSVLHRSDMMRSTIGLNRLATSFMSEPTKVYNMVLRDAYDIGKARRTGDKATLQKAGKHVGRTAAALIASFAVNAVARAIPDFFRDDDRDKDLQTFVDKLWENFRSDFEPWSYVPYVRDAVSIIQGFDVERSDLSGLSDFVQAANQLQKSLDGTGKKSVLNSGMELARKGAAALGIPVDNLMRDLTAIINTTLWATDQNEIVYNADKIMLNTSNSANDNTFYDTLYRAMRTDADQYLHIYTDMLANGFDSDEINKAMEKRLWKEAQQKWKDEDEITANGASLLPVEWEAPGEDPEWDKFLEEARGEDNWADTLPDDKWAMVQELENLPTGSSKEAVAEKRRAIADQPYEESIKEDAMEAILSDTAFSRYMAARDAGVSTYDYVNLLEDFEDEAARMAQTDKDATGNITKDVVEAVLKKSKLTTAQKRAIWSSYYKSKSPF